MIPMTLLEYVRGCPYGPYVADPTLEVTAPVMYNVDLDDMFTVTENPLPLTFLDAFVEGNKKM
jgi:hypothetical protein